MVRADNFMFILHGCTKGNCRRARSGISLIEILMSIGVLLVGLLGVVALFPAGQHRAQQSSMEDRKSLGGRRAVREFSIRAMDDTSNWIYNSQTLNLTNLPQPICIDPRLLGRRVDANNLLANNLSAWKFPFYRNQQDDGKHVLHRVSLKANPATPFDPNNVTISDIVQQMMSAPQAEHLFTFEDDLLFERPDDASLPPESVTLKPNSNDPDSLPIKRQADGHFSWMATLVPTPNLVGDYYHLSIVVFHKRVLQDPNFAADDAVDENVVQVNWPPNETYFSGDVNLVANSSPARLHLQSLSPGNWLLLNQLNPGGSKSYFRWYRVVAGAESSPSSGERVVTLQGPDWPVPSPGNYTAILVRNVVAVYEKTIRLEH